MVHKLYYWFQSFSLPKEVLKKATCIIMKLIWDGRSGASWPHMALPKKGGMRLCDLCLINRMALIRCVQRLWSNENSVWISCMNNRYIKAWTFIDIAPKQIDLAAWKGILRQKASILKCFKCNVGYQLIGLDWQWNIPHFRNHP